ncbi:4-(cytidine 5'-diphospho)-2-C-methyl-D-erythritol kinase [Roseomonas sp. BN140053]|uniref:4-(cytidine 5'-diphospho)-2-C-methyl-D-erythritol kinase n=1 Tax=Roseomonas sp. BN140053 TaxID=3391898 RepID=UPI0039EAD9F4
MTVPPETEAMTEAAPAKVNLFLHVTGRRPDGFHLLDSLAVFAAVGDTVSAEPAADLSLRVSGPESGELGRETDNLVLRAARLLATEAGVPPRAALRLEKRLPVASGIGGGSADAAATLRLLARLWGLPAPAPDLAASLGADVPVCVWSRAARMGGVGEALLPAPALPECGLVLANPRLPLATPAVFRARTGGFSAPAELPASWADAAAMAATLRRTGNDLEAAAIALCPPVLAVLAALTALPGCLLARMSGSGATCFALFATPAAAERAAARLPPGWWRWGGGLFAGG